MKRKLIYINLIVMIIVELFLLTGCDSLKKPKNYNDFLENIVDVNYIKISGHNINKQLDTKLAKLIEEAGKNALDIDKKTTKENTETGEQAYVFKLYSKDAKLLYWIQYYLSDNNAKIYSCSGTDQNVVFKESYIIKDNDILQYIKNIIR